MKNKLEPRSPKRGSPKSTEFRSFQLALDSGFHLWDRRRSHDRRAGAILGVCPGCSSGPQRAQTRLHNAWPLLLQTGRRPPPICCELPSLGRLAGQRLCPLTLVQFWGSLGRDPRPVGGARGRSQGGLCPGYWEDPPPSCHRAPLPSLAQMEGSHSEHSKMEEASAPGKGPRAGWTGALSSISVAYEDPQPPPRSLLCASSELAVFDLRFLISNNPTALTMKICPSRPWGCLIPWFSPTVGSSIPVG